MGHLAFFRRENQVHSKSYLIIQGNYAVLKHLQLSNVNNIKQVSVKEPVYSFSFSGFLLKFLIAFFYTFGKSKTIMRLIHLDGTLVFHFMGYFCYDCYFIFFD